LEKLGWEGPVYQISALNSEGLDALCWDIMRWIEDKAEAEAADAGLAEHEASLKVQMQTEARDRLEAYKQARKGGRPSDTNASDDDDDFDDDDYDVEVEYAP
jgi:GTP-binding protein